MSVLCVSILTVVIFAAVRVMQACVPGDWALLESLCCAVLGCACHWGLRSEVK